MDAFGLMKVTEPKFWRSFISADEKNRSETVRARWGTMLIDEYMPPILNLLRSGEETAPIVVREGGKKGKQKSIPTRKITFLIRESDIPNLSVEQFGHILDAVQNLYNAILKVHNLGQAELVVGSLDSGSDKSIDIIGVASAIAKLSDLLLQSWDRVRFGRSAKLSTSIKTASDGITLLAQISAAVTAGTISAAEGEKLRRTVVKNIDELFSNGVYTKEMEADVPILPKPTPSRETKANRASAYGKEIRDNGK
jgi:hypothetical protein